MGGCALKKNKMLVFALFTFSLVLPGCGKGSSGASVAAPVAPPTSHTQEALSPGWTTPTGQWPTSIAMDPSGNIYVANTFSNNIQKYNAAGALQWTSIVDSGPVHDASITVSVDGVGNVYAVSFLQSLPGSIQKYDPNGVLLWSIKTESNLRGGPVDSSGNIYVTGGSASNQLMKYGSDGTLQWTVPTDPSSNFAIAGAIDGSANVYVINQRTLQKFDSAGNLVWAQMISWTGSLTTSVTSINAVTTDNAGNIYLVNSTMDRNGEPTDGVLSKINSAGSIQWLADTVGSPSSVVVDTAGNIYVASMSGHGLLEKFDPSGGYIWSYQTPSSPSEIAVDSAGGIYALEPAANQTATTLGNGILQKFIQN